MTFAAEHDVVILGAGPAGTSAAIRLAQLGLDVGVVERQAFPRSHVGICLSDETLPLIDYLGLGQAFDDARFWRRNLTAVQWPDSAARLVPQDGYHVDRGVFDELLLRQSRTEGARVYQPVRVQVVERLEDLSWKITIASGERQQLLNARFVVDAAGRRPALRGPRIKDGPPLVALHANWKLAKAAAFDGLIEAGEDGWLWYAQTARDQAVVSVFCDPRRLRVSKGESVQAKYSDLLRQFRTLNTEHLGAQCSDAQACDASSQHCADPVGDHCIRLGDACFSVDPLSSQGVHLALQSGLQGAIVVNTMLRRSGNSDVAQRFFRTRVAGLIDRYTVRTKQEYARVAAVRAVAFWQERAGNAPVVESESAARAQEPSPCAPSDWVIVSPEVTVDAAPVLDGMFVEVRQVVRHPNIDDGGVAYVDGVDLARLLPLLAGKVAYRDIPNLWCGYIPPATGAMIASWLWSRRLLVPAR